jgi:uncharacterized membrane protein (TIGR02234 family)
VTAIRSPVGAILACAAGGLLLLLASGRQWARATLRNVSGGGTTPLSATGHVVAPSLPALGLALVALAAAILASKRTMRRVVGVVIVFVAAASVGVALSARGDVSSALEHRELGAQGLAVHASANGWWLVALLGGLIAVAAGILTVVRAAQWSSMGAKYDAPTAPAAPTKDPAAVAWDALDRGEDPTLIAELDDKGA